MSHYVAGGTTNLNNWLALDRWIEEVNAAKELLMWMRKSLTYAKEAYVVRNRKPICELLNN